MRILLVLALFLWHGLVFAAPLSWSLNNVSFADGTNINGSFTYDADTNAFTDILIGTQGSDSEVNFPPGFFAVGVEYTNLDSGNSSNADALWLGENVFLSCPPSFCDFRGLELSFENSLTNSGGVVDLNAGSRESATTPGYTAYRDIVSGSVSAVPIPAALWLFGSALAGLGWLRRKQTE